MSFLCAASIAIPANVVMTTAYARPSVQTPRTRELEERLKVREREPRYAARNCLDESWPVERPSVHFYFFSFFDNDNDSNGKTYMVDINIRYFHWWTFSLVSFHISVQG